jgi:hypothetical protein
MDPRARLEAWLKPVPADKHPTDPFELAVAQGTAAQETITVALRGMFALDEAEAPGWLTLWAGGLTSDEVEKIKARRDAETVGLHKDIDLLLGDDPEKWTPAERAHAETVGRRLAAVNLVLRARDAAKKEGQRTPFLPTKKVTPVAA